MTIVWPDAHPILDIDDRFPSQRLFRESKSISATISHGATYPTDALSQVENLVDNRQSCNNPPPTPLSEYP